MEIKGKIHCFFEQSGTFRDEFRKLGHEAEDYDIGNGFGKTDHVIDKDRAVRGSTGYWFVNCEPVKGLLSRQQTKAKDIGKIQNTPSAKVAGTCSMPRSMISPDYARNFICDFILGKKQEFTELTLF